MTSSLSGIEYLKRVSEIREKFSRQLESLRASLSKQALEEIRIAFLGRKGLVTSAFEDMRLLAKEDRPSAGKAINDLRTEIEQSLMQVKESVESAQLTKLLQQKPLDPSLPLKPYAGSLHPVTLMREELLREFRALGFSVWDGPEVDLDFYNFSALNFPDDHPARDMQDTFFIDNIPNTVLRTHTSNLEIHAMLDQKPPLRFVAPGRTYRCDSDPTHTPMFHQIEALMVDRAIHFSHMKGIIDHFLKVIFGSDLQTRLRPSFFPFVEPGAEVDMQCVVCRGKGCRLCKNTGWLEIGGCGMTHPHVFEAVGVDSEVYTGFAFGFGIDRMAMLKYALTDLRTLFEGQREFLRQFPSVV